jgi:L-ascorbate metabolism protein UlaG (beta-lactamase superfamily)
MELTWIGHSAIKIKSDNAVIYIDPFISENPAAEMDVSTITDADMVLVSHDHSDHMGDSFDICKKTGATLVSTFEIAQAAASEGITSEMMNVGGRVSVKGIHISMVPALHTGDLGGTAIGFVLEIDGHTIYYAGDTGLTAEMKVIAEVYQPELALLPIDGRFNMTPELAAKAVEYLGVTKAIPIHYNTFPAIQSSPEKFKDLCGDGCEVIILTPGDHLEI